MTKNNLILILLTFTLVGCTIEKRHYQKGFHVQWKHKTQAPQVAADKNQSGIIITEKEVIHNDLVISETLNNNNSEELARISSKVISNANSSNIIQQNREKPVRVSKKKTYSSDKHINAREVASTKHNFDGDGLLLFTSLFMALGTLLSFRTNRKRLNSITKWAANNTRKSQFIIGGIQVPLSIMAAYGGYNSAKMGFEFSDTSAYVLGGLLALSFASVPFLNRKKELVLEKKLKRRRLGFLGIILSGTMLFAVAGNNIATNSEALFHDSMEQLDQGLFNNDSPSISDDKESKNETRKYVNAGLVIIGALLFAILIALFCGGICGAIFSVYFIFSGEAIAFLTLALSILLIVLTFKGMKKLAHSKFLREEGYVKPEK